ncbi:OmpA family protein [Sulfitobacter mediterraneus]|uniref:Membrane protein n=1 Tax=Sulfitobacter mediterraneus TaxID=83219 RepID=A0A061SUS3_9RHOB|nr:OmpA family protein [Sulfitobacter mediterraneus]KAJ03254.1 membrane protein [Sulfitobacter mediterraneus]
MQQLLKSTTTLGLCLAMALPAPALAQSAGDLPQCDVDGLLEFPCQIDGNRIGDTYDAGRVLGLDRTALETLIARQTARAEAAAVEAQIAADAQAELEAEAAAEAATQAAAQAQEDTQAEAEAAATAQAEAEAAAANAQAEAQAEADAEAAAQAEARAAEKQAAKEARREERRAQRRAEREAERAAARAAAEAAAEGNAEAEVTTQEVQQDEVRSSDEEFDTAVTGSDQPVAKDDGGLSKFEKALLLGLGAVVVGSVLKNGDKVVSRSGDRVVVEDPNGDLRVLKDDDALIRRPGDEVRTETFDDGSTRTIVTKPDNSRIVTIRGRDGTVLRRISVDPQGREFVLVDDLVEEQEVIVNELPQVVQDANQVGKREEADLRAALQAEMQADQQRRFSLRQVREIPQVRALAPQLELDAVQFATGSAAIRPEQARSLARIGRALSDLIAKDPRTVILVEGHTDAVGNATYNLALSDRRAETVALAMTEYFDVPPQNMITQGYGESDLKVRTLENEPANRRAVVRNITGLLR